MTDGVLEESSGGADVAVPPHGLEADGLLGFVRKVSAKEGEIFSRDGVADCGGGLSAHAAYGRC